MQRSATTTGNQRAKTLDIGIRKRKSPMGVVPESVLQGAGPVPRRIRNEDEISFQESLEEHRFNSGDIVCGDVSVGDMVAAKRGGEAAPDVGSRGVFARSNGHHHGDLFGIDHRARASLCARNHSGDGPRICGLPLVAPTG